MLNGIHLVDFANHRDTRLMFGRMTALVGMNGAGKTSVMRAVECVAGNLSVSDFKRSKTHHPILTAAWNGKEHATDVGVFLSTTEHVLTRKRTDSEQPGSWLPDPVDDAEQKTGAWNVQKWFEGERPRAQPGEKRYWAAHDDDWSWKVRYFKTSARALHRPSHCDDEHPYLKSEGANLAWVLSYLMTADPDRFSTIMDAVRQVVPVVKRVRARPIQLTRIDRKTITINRQEKAYDEEQTVMGQELIFDMVSGNGLSASAVSEGTLVVLAVMTLIHSEDSVDMIMLDDIELGLHPRAQRDLIKQLRRVQEAHPKLQILMSTHSPYIVDELSPEEVWMMAPDSEGCAVAKRLSDHPDAKRALEVLSTGEFWSAQGEDWVLEKEESNKVAETPEA